MKRLIITATIALLSLSSTFAQPRQERGERAPRENFHQFQKEMVIKQLNIDESKQAQFEQLYTKYTTEMEALRPKHIRGKEQNTLSDSQIEQQILDSFEAAEKTNALKREYYTKFKAILTPQQILEMYNTEHQINMRLNSELQNRANGRRGREGEANR